MKSNVDEKIGVRVGDIMTRNLITAKPEISVKDAAKIMTKKRVGSLLLVEKEELKGILTEKDIIWALSKKSKKDLSQINAKDICAKKITTIKPSADLSDAIRLMRKKKFRRLPVTVKKKVIGYLTLKDILRIQPELFEIAKEHKAIKEIREESAKVKRTKIPENFKESICEECGNYDVLSNEDGRLICKSCRDAM
jgi:CBS domain-containing protein